MSHTPSFRRLYVLAFFLLLGLVVLPASVPVAGAEKAADAALSSVERAWLTANPEKLVLYYNTDFPPIEFISAKGDFTGLGADVIGLVEERLGVRFIKQPCQDWNRHLAALAEGACAVAPTIVATREREKYAYFTTPYASAPVVIITRRGTSHGLSLDELAGKNVAVVSGFATEAYAQKASRGRFKIVTVSHVPEGLHSVSLGHVDAFLENLAVAAYYIDREGISNLCVAGTTDYVFDWSIGVSRKYPLLFSAVQKALSAIPESTLSSVQKKWIPLEVAAWLSKETWRLIKVAAVFTVLLLVGLVIIAYVLKRRLNEKVVSLEKAYRQMDDHVDRLRLATEALNAGVWEFYPAGGDSYISNQWFTMLGYPAVGRKVPLAEFQAYVHPDDWPVMEKALTAYVAGGGQGQFEVEFRLRKADGDWCWFLSKGQAVERDKAGAVSRMTGLDINIESIKQSQERLARSESWFRAIFENAPYAIAITRLEDSRYLAVNRAFLEAREIDRDQLGCVNLEDDVMISEEEAADVRRTLLQEGVARNREARVRRSDGDLRDIIYSSVLLDLQGDKQVLSITQDVTEQRRGQKALQESEARFRALFKMAPIPMVTISLDGLILDVNNRMIETVGYTTDDVPTLEHWWRLAYPDPDYRRQQISNWNAVFDRISASAAAYNLGENRIICKNGRELTAIIHTNRIREFIVITFFDITARKEAEEEREKLQQQLLQAQKLEAVGVLAGGVAHDFNNMLGAIIGFTELTIESMAGDSPHRQYLENIHEAARHSIELTGQLLAFARKQPIQPVTLDLNEAVGAMIKILRRLMGENIELIWQPATDPCIVRLDPSQLDQVVTNLCVNARDAIADVGKITITTSCSDSAREGYQDQTGPFPGQYVILSVSDDGCGMDRQTVAHIFEPFFTTKKAGKGTGLGLATVYGIVKQNEGFVDVDSAPGKGTTFRIYFRGETAESGADRSEKVPPIPSGRGEAILFVEDDPLFRDMGLTMLRRLGYKVVAAAAPGEAMALIETPGVTIDLLITDVIMPVMNGRELVDRVQSRRSDIKYLFMSGYTADVIVNRGVLESGINFIQKPFSLRDIAVKIREVLDKPA